MLTSLSPLGERARNSHWSVTAAWHLLGTAAGGASVGAAAGLVGIATDGIHASPTTAMAILAFGIAVALMVDAGLVRVPKVQRQVNEDWIYRYRGWVYGFGFGFQLGFAVVTVATTAAVYAMLLAIVLAQSMWVGVVVGVAFGLTRGLTLLITSHATTPEALARLDATVARLDHPSKVATNLTEAVIPLVLIGATFIGPIGGN